MVERGLLCEIDLDNHDSSQHQALCESAYPRGTLSRRSSQARERSKEWRMSRIPCEIRVLLAAKDVQTDNQLFVCDAVFQRRCQGKCHVQGKTLGGAPLPFF